MKFIRATILCVLLSGSAGSAAEKPAAPAKPNNIIILSDVFCAVAPPIGGGTGW